MELPKEDRMHDFEWVTNGPSRLSNHYHSPTQKISCPCMMPNLVEGPPKETSFYSVVELSSMRITGYYIWTKDRRSKIDAA